MKKAFFLLLSTTVFLFSSSPLYAERIAIGVSPPIIHIVADPPANILTPITLQNLTDQSTTFRIIFKPFIPSGKENGQGVYIANEKGIPGPDQEIFEKVQILDNDHSVETLTLGPKQQKTFTLHIGIPEDEPLSDYYFSIVFINKTDQKNESKNFSSTSAGVATNVLLSIGKEDAKGGIKEFSAPNFLGKGPVPFTVRIANAGEHVIAPNGSIIIHNMFNQPIGEVTLLPVNILAHSTRAIPDTSQNPENKKRSLAAQYSIYAPVALWQENFLLGFYTATLTVSLSNNGPVYIRSTNFTAFPISLFIALFIISFILLLIRKRLKSRLSQQ